MVATPLITPAFLYNGVQLTGPTGNGTLGQVLSSGGDGTTSWEDAAAGGGLAQDSFSSASGALGTVPTFYAATVGSSYSKALAASAGVDDGTIIEIRVVSLTGTSLLTITPDGSDVIRHCGADLSSMVLAMLGAELGLRKRGAGWDVVHVRGRQKQQMLLHTGNGQGSTNTKIRRWTTTEIGTGTAIVAADSASLGGSFTIAESGDYAITRNDLNSAGAIGYGVSKNSNQLTTDFFTITQSHTTGVKVITPAANFANTGSDVVACVVGDVLRGHDGSTVANGTASSSFIHIIKLGE